MTLRRCSQDRWLLSYADFVTLLFAVFVMMYAIEKSHPKQSPVPRPPVPVVAVPPPSAPPSKRATLLDDFQKNLMDEQKAGFLTLSAEPRGVVVEVNDQSLFKPGDASVQASANASFEKIGSLLARYPNHILLEGHTDSVPIHNERFRSNWELSTARSMAVMEVLERQSAIPASRFSIGGSADNAPLAPDNTEPGRARNRRVDIIVMESDVDPVVPR